MRIDKRERYLKARISQLREEIPKNEGDDLTQEWYNRLIQELQWVVDIGSKEEGRSNCWMPDNVQ